MRAQRRGSSSEMGASPDGAARQRLCAVTRAERCQDDLIRFVADPEGRIVPDLGARLPGRGVWVTADAQIVAQAAKSGVFARSLRSKVNVAADLSDLVGELLTRRVTDGLSLANKAGLVTSGFSLVDASLDAGAVAVLLHGSDAAEGGCEKLDRKFHAVARSKGQSPAICTCLTTAQLSLALGRPNVVHASLKSGGVTKRFLVDVERLSRYRLGFFTSGCAVPAGSRTA